MLDVVATLVRYNAGRDPERLAMKYANMRASPFVFLRGTCHLFYDRLCAHKHAVELPKGAPTVWACGDLHLENFGSYKGDNRLAYFDLNDFDEAALAPATWELVRVLTSVLTAAGSLGFKPSQATLLCKAFIASYAAALESGKARWLERETAQGLIEQLLSELRNRKRAAYLDARTVLKKRERRIICDARHALPASEAEHARARQLVERIVDPSREKGFFDVLDVARRIAGTGSLGVERYVVLVRGKGSPDGNYLLDVKRALPSSISAHLPKPQPDWTSEAHRVVGVETRMQAVSAAFLHPVVKGGKSYVVRGLQPSEDRIDLTLSAASLARITQALQDMGRLTAWAQLRSAGRSGSAIADQLIDFGADRSKWQAGLLDASRQCTAQTLGDWKTFVKAYDAHRFDAPTKST